MKYTVSKNGNSNNADPYDLHANYGYWAGSEDVAKSVYSILTKNGVFANLMVMQNEDFNCARAKAAARASSKR